MDLTKSLLAILDMVNEAFMSWMKMGLPLFYNRAASIIDSLSKMK